MAVEMNVAGPLTSFLVADHRRLDALFQQATADPHRIDDTAYDQFRAGLLRHIGMEEKILLPAAQRLNRGALLPIAARLRLDHGALAALLMPSPTAAICTTIQRILVSHNEVEEGPGGLYELCDELVAAEAESLLAKLRAAPDVKVMAHSNSMAVMTTVRRALERAGYAAEV
jgi:hypothetical protein